MKERCRGSRPKGGLNEGGYEIYPLFIVGPVKYISTLFPGKVVVQTGAIVLYILRIANSVAKYFIFMKRARDFLQNILLFVERCRLKINAYQVREIRRAAPGGGSKYGSYLGVCP